MPDHLRGDLAASVVYLIKYSSALLWCLMIIFVANGHFGFREPPLAKYNLN